MSFTETWDETKPSGGRARSLGDDDIREFKRAMTERMAVDHLAHSDESGQSNVYYHKKVGFGAPLAADPSNAANVGFLYTKDVNGKVELFFIDEDGDAIQLSNPVGVSILSDVDGWRSGDLLLSSSTDTPTGWSDVSTTYDNKFIRIGDDTPLTTTGGADTHDHGAATASHTLTEAQMPAHTHTVTGAKAAWADSADGEIHRTSTGTQRDFSTNSAGSGGGHSHVISSADNMPAWIQTRMYKKD